MNTIKQIFTLSFIFLFFIISKAQNKCGFDVQREIQRQDPNFVELERLAEEKIKSAILNQDFSRRMAGSVLTIPVVIHVLHLGEAVGSGTNISDTQIQSSIDNLNDFYGGQTAASPLDFEIQFALAQRDPSCSATTGINRIDASGVPNYSANGVSFAGAGADETTLKDLSRWPETDYFNIWIVSEIDGNNGGSGYQGYANFFNGSAYEGSVMMHTVFGNDPTNANPSWPLNFARDNSTVVHEAGHYFHLFHTFQGDGSGGTCPLDVTIGTDSDGCADTVPHKRETSTCPAVNSCTLTPWIDNNTINNIMSYYSCTDKMTNDQKTRVRAAMEGTSIVNSKGFLAPIPNFTAPNAVCDTNTVMTYAAGITSVELNGISSISSFSATDGGNIDKSGGCTYPFEIDTAVSNTLNVGVANNLNQLGVWIDWNDDGDFDDDSEQQYLVNGGIAANSVTPITLTYPMTIPYGDFVRIRIINDLDPIYGVSAINSSCHSLLTYGQSEDYAIYVKLGPITYTYNNGWLPNNPVGISTSSDTIIVEAGTANINANTDCSTLTVNPGAALTVDTGVTITAATVDLNSTSQLFSSLILDGTITGVVNYNRHTPEVGPVGTNDLISAPISGQLFPAFAVLNDNLAATGDLRAFAPYNTTVGAYQNYDLITNLLTTIDAGVGYRAATTDGGTLTFTGTVRTDDVLDVPITDAASGYAWNLIGNPYPSYIDFDAFFTLNASSQFETSGAFQAIYGYDGDASNGWTIWNLATIADGTITELIAPGQAFFVKSKVGGGLVDFTTSMRRIGSSDDFISGRNSTNVALCKLNLSSDNNNASTQIYFIEGTTRGLDAGYDAGSYLGSAAEFSIFSNLVEDNMGLDMAIQTLPYDDFNNVIVPLGIKAQANLEITISIDDTSTFPMDTNVYLEDTFENTLTLLNDTVYTFTPSTILNGIGRFYLRYSSESLSIKDNELNSLHIYATEMPKELVINGLLISKTEAEVYDIQGRLVMNEVLDTSNMSNKIDVSTLSTGIYIIKVFNKGQLKTQKLIIN